MLNDFDIDWADIWSTIFAVYYFAQRYVYPGLTPEQVIASIQDLTIFGHLFDMGMIWFMMRLKRQSINVKYVTGKA